MMPPKSNKIHCIPFYNRCQGKNRGVIHAIQKRKGFLRFTGHQRNVTSSEASRLGERAGAFCVGHTPSLGVARSGTKAANVPIALRRLSAGPPESAKVHAECGSVRRLCRLHRFRSYTLLLEYARDTLAGNLRNPRLRFLKVFDH